MKIVSVFDSASIGEVSGKTDRCRKSYDHFKFTTFSVFRSGIFNFFQKNMKILNGNNVGNNLVAGKKWGWRSSGIGLGGPDRKSEKKVKGAKNDVKGIPPFLTKFDDALAFERLGPNQMPQEPLWRNLGPKTKILSFFENGQIPFFGAVLIGKVKVPDSPFYLRFTYKSPPWPVSLFLSGPPF